MRLMELTAKEAAWLDAGEGDALAARLERRLGGMFTARLRMPVGVQRACGSPSDTRPALPVWQPDATVSTLWLTRRLGGRSLAREAAFVPSSLLHALDEVLAESWLDGPAALPPALAWRLTCGLGTASLALQLPGLETEMTRWAQGAIHHV